MVTVDFDHTFRIYWEMSDKNISISFFFLYILTRQKKKKILCQVVCQIFHLENMIITTINY